MVRWLRRHCSPDTEFEIRSLAVWGRARYLSVMEAFHNTDFHTWMGKKHFSFFQTAETGNRTPNSGVKGSSANHYPRAPAQALMGMRMCNGGKEWWGSFEGDEEVPKGDEKALKGDICGKGTVCVKRWQRGKRETRKRYMTMRKWWWGGIEGWLRGTKGRR